MRFLLIIMIGLFMIPSFACEFTSSAGGMRTANIGSNVHIYASDHLTGQVDVIMGALSSAVSRPDVVNRFNAIRLDEKNQIRIQEEMQDVQRITDLVKGGKVQWIGIEASPSEMANGVSIENQVEDYRGMTETLKIIETEPGWSANASNELLHLMYTAEVIARANNSEAFARVTTVALESDQLKAFGKRAEAGIDWARDKLIAHGINRELTIEQFEQIEALRTKALREFKPISNEDRKKMLEQFTSTKVKASIAAYAIEIEEFLKNSTARSEAAAVAIAGQTGDGLVLFGTSHGSEIEKAVTAACKNGGSSAIRPRPRSSN